MTPASDRVDAAARSLSTCQAPIEGEERGIEDLGERNVERVR
jgi:hypothetical protein